MRSPTENGIPHTPTRMARLESFTIYFNPIQIRCLTFISDSDDASLAKEFRAVKDLVSRFDSVRRYLYRFVVVLCSAYTPFFVFSLIVTATVRGYVRHYLWSFTSSNLGRTTRESVFPYRRGFSVMKMDFCIHRKLRNRNRF